MCDVDVPSTDSDWTYGADELPPLIGRFPVGRWISTLGNRPPCTASVSAPGVTGDSPSAAQTYQAEVAPRSSLPGRPPAPAVNDSDITRRTAALAPDGLPTKLYVHGTPCSGSLPT